MEIINLYLPIYIYPAIIIHYFNEIILAIGSLAFFSVTKVTINKVKLLDKKSHMLKILFKIMERKKNVKISSERYCLLILLVPSRGSLDNFCF